jgi:signal transduction histidine kinase
MQATELSAQQLLSYLTWLFYVLTFVAVTIGAVRRPNRASIDMVLLFGAPAIIIGINLASNLGLLEPSSVTSAINGVLLLAMGYFLLRLVDDFSDVPAWLLRVSEAGLLLAAIGLIAYPPGSRPIWLTAYVGLYLMVLLIYTTWAFLKEAQRSSGVTRRRMLAVAVGSISLFVVILIAEALAFVPGLRPLTGPLNAAAGLFSGIGYLLGFAPPGILRRAWQEPELRAFLSRAATLPRLPDTESIVREMEKGAATSIGASSASIGLWDEQDKVLRFSNLPGGKYDLAPMEGTVAGRAFLHQIPVFTDDLDRDSPVTAELAHSYGVNAVMAAPITAGEKRLGVLTVASTRTPIFADEDLALVKLLADQAAVILESRALIDEAARVRAREEVTRLKEDFLSAAAHDLKTPLTTLVAQTQLLERRVTRNPNQPIELASLQKLVREAQRLRDLVLELLDAARTEQGRLVGERAEMDIMEAATETCARHSTERHPCTVEGESAVAGVYDSNRILQLLENLVENAIKYSPNGGEVRVRLWQEGDSNHITVSDQGIGIPQSDLPHLFDRFHRGSNVDDRRFAGMGLGLYICRGIAEQHGGRIWATSTPGKGSTFHVELPAAEAIVRPEPEPSIETTAAPQPVQIEATPDIAGGRA